MKIHLFAGAALALAFSAPAAFAQPNDVDWTGPYVGVDLGAAFTHDHIDELAPAVPIPPRGIGTENLSPVEPIGGGLVGYNWQFHEHFVLGFEGDFEGSGVHRTSHCLVQANVAFNPAPGACFPGSYFNSYDSRWQASARGRLGYAMGPTLLYVTGGAAWANFVTNYGTTVGLPGVEKFTTTLPGYTVGVGADTAISPHLRLGVEYRYSGFAGFINQHTSAAGSFWESMTDKNTFRENAIRVRLVYAFNAPAPPPP
ncbi:MAG TPA: outer membrane beta-barrel protein, partial [Stellaceae bacterium]|nr:outer membrane beta-barrel protein [Stellaceae bacterium]